MCIPDFVPPVTNVAVILIHLNVLTYQSLATPHHPVLDSELYLGAAH